ncbi:MAG TPA: PIN domain-containing protein [Candidatus Cloacimonetes bacterium]|nr:PIN domain-containing protein [Candidatus Cloacimonadota bacterium]
MKVLVDTSVWSLALRRKEENMNEVEKEILNELVELIKETRVVMVGPVRQEILSGIKSQNQFKKLKSKLSAFSDLPINSEDYEKAAEFYNTLMSKGVQGSFIDFLLCAVSYNNDFSIFTTDYDFINFAEHIEIKIHEV